MGNVTYMGEQEMHFNFSWKTWTEKIALET